MKVTLFRRQTTKGKVYYAKWQRNGRYVKRSLNTTSRKMALNIKEQMEAELTREKYGLVTEADWTPEDAWKEYLRLVSKRPSTIATEKFFWDEFWSWTTAPTLRCVRRADVSLFQKQLLAKGNSAVTVNDKVRQIGTVWNWLIREELYDGQNPFAGRRRLDEGPRKIRVIPWEQVETLLRTAAQRWREAEADYRTAQNAGKAWRDLRNLAYTRQSLYLGLVLAAYAGLRRGELLAARWEHIDWERETLAVQGTKTAGSHSLVHLHPTLRETLTAHRRDEGYIVAPDTKQGKGPLRFDFSKEWRVLRNACGLEDARLHDLRHSFATRLLDLGYPLKDIAVMLRHASTRQTEQYADLRTVKVQIGRLS